MRRQQRPREQRIQGMRISKGTAEAIKAIKGWHIARGMKNWYLHADSADEQPN